MQSGDHSLKTKHNISLTQKNYCAAPCVRKVLFFLLRHKVWWRGLWTRARDNSKPSQKATTGDGVPWLRTLANRICVIVEAWCLCQQVNRSSVTSATRCMPWHTQTVSIETTHVRYHRYSPRSWNKTNPFKQKTITVATSEPRNKAIKTNPDVLVMDYRIPYSNMRHTGLCVTILPGYDREYVQHGYVRVLNKVQHLHSH